MSAIEFIGLGVFISFAVYGVICLYRNIRNYFSPIQTIEVSESENVAIHMWRADNYNDAFAIVWLKHRGYHREGDD
jgi:hypothetical protein